MHLSATGNGTGIVMKEREAGRAAYGTGCPRLPPNRGTEEAARRKCHETRLSSSCIP